ncbi:hypothetical protein KP509_1Z107200 [Ceratopteris richardii]|nr:hypothetical protein KP509_1Z107200 [Ceratopteris richardii]KAH6557551.1 hypothetical protein KP509_1Z107200 [Ceratopteris richardii]KAH6557552.1 hypothetical protein KP509_1Z107200 [Ceratopteris richardii]KAH6557553.1 hypothetical protein KP509_1Z107200 [Ceratopteris richardii]KAH6557554.1 hypothetical protein KP509_1Z107200 [Ceratopteris richardii]
MKAKGKTGWISTYKFPMPLVLLLCLACFLAGLFGSRHQHLPQDRINREASRRSLEFIEDTDEILMEHGETGDDDVTEIRFQVLSWQPRALYFPNFASKEKCEAIIKLAKSRLTPSSLALRKGETEENTKDTRTSSGTFLIAKQDKSGSLGWVEQKMARATMVPVSHGEAFNVLRYEIGQKYNSHYDFFNPAEYGPQKSQRMASFLLYLSDVEEGGETMFPFEGYKNMDIGYDYKECIGLKVKPRQGDALLFYSMFHNGTFDKASLHGSCPVIKGEKWVATKWIRDQDRW